MEEDPLLSLRRHFEGLEDPRAVRARRHELLDIVVIALCGVICGADSWVDIAEFGLAKLQWFQQFLHLPNGIPSHDTFGRVFARLDPESLPRRTGMPAGLGRCVAGSRWRLPGGVGR